MYTLNVIYLEFDGFVIDQPSINDFTPKIYCVRMGVGCFRVEVLYNVGVVFCDLFEDAINVFTTTLGGHSDNQRVEIKLRENYTAGTKRQSQEGGIVYDPDT